MNTTLVFGSIGWWEVFIGGISTLAIYSFLYRENPFYRFFEHLYIGIGTGIGIVAGVKFFIWPKLLKPLLGLDRMVFPDGTSPVPYDTNNLLLLLPMAFGMLYYFIYSRRYNWLAQLVIGFSLGVGGGFFFKGFFNEVLPQITDTFRPLYVPGSLGGTITNIIFVLILLCTMSYFFFTFKRGRGGIVEKSAAIGRLMMMGCFGAFFGSTIMARMALLVERLDFFIKKWWPALM